jgi:PAS domain-containing protein
MNGSEVGRDGQRLQVTASALVRHFGEWQERAARAPVYVLHHGRPRLLLVGVELAARLAGAERPSSSLLDPVLDSLDLPLLLLDAAGLIARANAAARARFGDRVAPRGDVASLSQRDGGTLAAAVRRVLDGAARERVAVAVDRAPARVLGVTVEPLPEGCLLRIEDETSALEAQAAAAARDSISAAFEATGLAALARVSLRGHLVAPRPALAALLRLPPALLTGARFLALVDPADRPAVGDLLERACGGDTGGTAAAALLTSGGETLAVALSFWPIRVNGRVEEVLAAVVRRAA